MQVGCMVGSSTWLFIAILLVTLHHSARAIPGKYQSLGGLMNKWFPTYIEKHGEVDKVELDECTEICVKHDTCTGFAYSIPYSICLLYVIKPGTPPIEKNGYDIYIRMYDESDGYYPYKSGYIRLMLKRESAPGARQNCSKQGGSLVAIRGGKEEVLELNALLYTLLVKYNIWQAYIGASDEQEEGVWRWPDGGSLGEYVNWDWNGKWDRRDRNCAVILNTANMANQCFDNKPWKLENCFNNAPWKHTECSTLGYYFCQIPKY